MCHTGHYRDAAEDLKGRSGWVVRRSGVASSESMRGLGRRTAPACL